MSDLLSRITVNSEQCGGGPCLQVNGTYHENLTNEKVDRLLAGLS